MRQSDELTKSASLHNNFTFSRMISREVLENYLSRAVTAQDVVKSDTLDDDIRMLTNIGAKFIGRAACTWRPEEDDDAWFDRAARAVEKIDAADPEIIVQAGIFEAVCEGVERIPVPELLKKTSVPSSSLPREGETTP